MSPGVEKFGALFILYEEWNFCGATLSEKKKETFRF